MVADICAHVNPLPLFGIFYVAPLPFMGQMLPRTIAPPMLRVVQVLGSTRDTAVVGRAKTDFVNGLVAGPVGRIADAKKAGKFIRHITFLRLEGANHFVSIWLPSRRQGSDVDSFDAGPLG